MYENALATAGIKDADIIVAGPFNISGTAALVGAIKSYENMTGEAVKTENVETATNELVVTGKVAESVGDTDKAEQLIGAVKEQVVEGRRSYGRGDWRSGGQGGSGNEYSAFGGGPSGHCKTHGED